MLANFKSHRAYFCMSDISQMALDAVLQKINSAVVQCKDGGCDIPSRRLEWRKRVEGGGGGGEDR